LNAKLCDVALGSEIATMKTKRLPF